MFFRHLIALFLLPTMLTAQELKPLFEDDFSSSPESRWDLAGPGWTHVDGQLRVDAGGELWASATDAPEGGVQVIEADVTILERRNSSGWAVAGICLYQDRGNYWQWALCEGPPPQKTRYCELGEEFRGVWKANAVRDTALKQLSHSSFAWEYGVTYRGRIRLEPNRIAAQFLDAGGKVLGESSYELREWDSLRSGSVGFRMLGVRARIDNVLVRAVPPPTPTELGVSIQNGRLGRVALLLDSLPGADSALVKVYAEGLREQGFGVTELDCETLSKPGILARRNFDAICLVQASCMPSACIDAIRRFLRHGGDLISVGGIPCEESCLRMGGKWLRCGEARRVLDKTEPTHLLFGFDKATDVNAWERSSDNVGKTASTVVSATGGQDGSARYARFNIKGLTAWDTFYSEDLVDAFPGENALTCFWVRGHADTPDIAVEWREKDGARWIATVPVTGQWRHVALRPEDFAFWGKTPGRGGPGDELKPDQAVRLNFGIATSHTSCKHGDHGFDIDQVGTAPWPIPKGSFRAGEHLSLDAFSDAYPWERLDGATALVGRDGTWIPSRPVGAVVMGFPKPEISTFEPLLRAVDQYRRPRGAAGGLVVHFGGPFRRSRWLLFSPENTELLASGPFVWTVARSATRLARSVYVVDAQPDRLTYPPGAPVHIEPTVVQLGADEATVELAWTVLAGQKTIHHETKTLTLGPLESLPVALSWTPSTADAALRSRVEILVDGKASSTQEADLYTLSQVPASQCPGPLRLSADGKHIVYPDGRRFFCIGANYTASLQHHGRFFQDAFFTPRLLEAHFRASREAGINVWRSCGWCWSAPIAEEILRSDFRKVDLVMELACQYGVYQYIAPPGVHELDLEKRLAVYKALARHLRGHPAVFGYDLQNEPGIVRLTGLKYPDGQPCSTQAFDFTKVYGEVLAPKLKDIREQARQRRYYRHRMSPELTDKQAFNVACAAFLYAQWRREYRISFSTFPQLDEFWPPSPKWRPALDAINAGLEAYVKVQCDAIREEDPTHLISVGYNQCLSVFPGNEHLDFVSQHIYQRPYTFADVKQNITTLDRLAQVWPNKPITLGEFGYSNGIAMGDGAYLDVNESAVGEMIHYLYAVSQGYDGCKKWVLNDCPLVYMHHFGGWSGRGLATQTYEERFGVYAYDGTLPGRRKPIGAGLAFLRRYIDRAGPTGKLTLSEGEDNAKAHYEFRGDKTWFIGGRRHDGAGLAFTSTVPVNVMLDWGDGALRICATADVAVRLDPEAFLGKTASSCQVTGLQAAGLRRGGRFLNMALLEGEVVVVKERGVAP